MQFMNSKIDTLQSQVEDGKHEREVKRHLQEEEKQHQDQEMSPLYDCVSELETANGNLQNELAVARSPESQRKRRAEEDAGGSGQHKRAANAKGRPVAVGAAVASVAPTRTTQTMMEKLIQLTSADGQAAHYKLIGMDHWSLRLWRHATMESVRLP